jgi:hypothetical protein
MSEEPDLHGWNRLIGRWDAEGAHPMLPGEAIRGTSSFEWRSSSGARATGTPGRTISSSAIGALREPGGEAMPSERVSCYLT